MLAYLSVLVLIIGLIVYLMPAPAKVNEIGRLMFFVGLLWLVRQYIGHMINLKGG